MALELRWFFYGPLPDGIAQWLKTLPYKEIPKPKGQPDLYLLARGCDYIGIKRRKGKDLEIKLRSDIYDYKLTNREISGNIEDWIKLRWEDATLRPRKLIPLFFNEEPEGHWVKVRKKRRKLYCAIPKDGPPKTSKKEVKRGISWEITNSEDNSWWSIAFDAIGDEKEQMKILQLGVDWVLKNYPADPEFKLQKKNSYGYPKLLSMLF